ncbi:MAG: peptidylprolyl isomerase [Clostridia bacterium]|nr:peptidylprolyl isomerase [Clostridia bacterium]
MKKKLLRRIGSIAVAAVLSAGTLMMFAGCTSSNPEVRVTYTFNGEEYEVDYVLSRNDAPQTVIHFLELAEKGYYEGMCIHNYTSNALFAGGYKLVDENGEVFDYAKNSDNSQKTFALEEVDYFTEVKKLETGSFKFTQSVWMAEGTDTDPRKGNGMYTVYGEFSNNGVNRTYTENRHNMGALVMYYTQKYRDNVSQDDVTVLRADGGKGNDDQPYQNVGYNENSATSLFYTWLSSSTTNSDYNADKYCVFGKAKNYVDQLQNGLLQAVEDYIAEISETMEEFSFTERMADLPLNQYEPFEKASKSGFTASYDTPLEMPIVIKSVKITKY